MSTRKFTADGILTHRQRVSFEMTEAEYQAAIEKYHTIADYVYETYSEEDYECIESISDYYQPTYDPKISGYNGPDLGDTRIWSAAFVKEWTMQLVAGEELSMHSDNGTYKG